MSLNQSGGLPEHRYLLKFLLMSAVFLFIGTVHGVIQVQPPVRAWLESVGTPHSGPGHMIDPLAHAHMNIVGGVILFIMAGTYYLFPTISGQPLYSRRLVEHTFWWTSIGQTSFYLTLMTFGIIEGNILLTNPEALPEVHRYYKPIIGTAATIMGIGFWVYFANIFLTARRVFKNKGVSVTAIEARGRGKEAELTQSK